MSLRSWIPTLCLCFMPAMVAVANDAFSPPQQARDYMEPAFERRDQEQETAEKLKKLQNKFGRKPNVVILLVDDMGWGDPGCFGGGALIGAPTPTIEKAQDIGLKKPGSP